MYEIIYLITKGSFDLDMSYDKISYIKISYAESSITYLITKESLSLDTSYDKIIYIGISYADNSHCLRNFLFNNYGS